MCGICGIFEYGSQRPIDAEELRETREAMLSRGPDDKGLWVATDRRVGLGHRRLSILDLSSAGAQPMADMTGQLRIVFNGEIYNYRLLRRNLESKGYRFASSSDTEVLLCLYDEYGVGFPSMLRGMYAFAIWDDRRKGLLLGRDPFGIKPLYISDDGHALRFASQVKALAAGRGVDMSASPAGHVGFFLWGHVPEPFTLYKKIRALEPGCILWIDQSGRQEQRRFYSIRDTMRQPSKPAAQSEHADNGEVLRSALLDSIKHHLVSDVPVGLFLSCGLDSATILALASEVSNTPLQTITLGFSEYRNTELDEAPLARVIATHYRSSHTERFVSKFDFDGERERMLAAMDQPSIDGVNTYFVSKAAKEAGLKVVLSGLGGDEVFGGYPSFRRIPRLVRLASAFHAAGSMGRGLRRVSYGFFKELGHPKHAGIFEYGGSYGGAYLLNRALYMPWELPAVLDADLVKAGWSELKALASLNEMTHDFTGAHAKVAALELCWYMRNQLLRDADWAGMAHSIEIRVPLVDTELLAAVVRTGTSGTSAKQRMAACPVTALPDTVRNRRKTGFSIPVRAWTSHRKEPGLRDWAQQVYLAHAGRDMLTRV